MINCLLNRTRESLTLYWGHKRCINLTQLLIFRLLTADMHYMDITLPNYKDVNDYIVSLKII